MEVRETYQQSLLGLQGLEPERPQRNKSSRFEVRQLSWRPPWGVLGQQRARLSPSPRSPGTRRPEQGLSRAGGRGPETGPCGGPPVELRRVPLSGVSHWPGLVSKLLGLRRWVPNTLCPSNPSDTRFVILQGENLACLATLGEEHQTHLGQLLYFLYILVFLSISIPSKVPFRKQNNPFCKSSVKSLKKLFSSKALVVLLAAL